MSADSSRGHVKTARLRVFDTLPDTAPVDIPTSMTLLGISRTTYWRRVRDGSLPKPDRILGRLSLPAGVLRQVMRGERPSHTPAKPAAAHRQEAQQAHNREQ